MWETVCPGSGGVSGVHTLPCICSVRTGKYARNSSTLGYAPGSARRHNISEIERPALRSFFSTRRSAIRWI